MGCQGTDSDVSVAVLRAFDNQGRPEVTLLRDPPMSHRMILDPIRGGHRSYLIVTPLATTRHMAEARLFFELFSPFGSNRNRMTCTDLNLYVAWNKQNKGRHKTANDQNTKPDQSCEQVPSKK